LSDSEKSAVTIHRSSYWTLDAADWTFEEDGGSAVLTPPDESAKPQILTCDFGTGLTRNQLVAWAGQRVPAVRSSTTYYLR
jgi:hypothetical protein